MWLLLYDKVLKLNQLNVYCISFLNQATLSVQEVFLKGFVVLSKWVLSKEISVIALPDRLLVYLGKEQIQLFEFSIHGLLSKDNQLSYLLQFYLDVVCELLELGYDPVSYFLYFFPIFFT